MRTTHLIAGVTLATVATTTLLSTAAPAADLPSRRAPPVFAPPPPIPVFTWTGLYVGAQAGYAFGRSNTLGFLGPAAVGGGGRDMNGFIGGGHVGYLFSTQSIPVLGQLTGAASAIPFFGGVGGAGGVFGIEGDVDGSTQSASYAFGGNSVYTKRPIQGSVRGRLGFAVDRVLFYATGGAAFGDLRSTYATGNSFNRTRVGYTVGGGIEYAVTNNVSIRAEYRYTDFGSYVNVLTPITAARVREYDNRVQAGISYKFDTFTPSPVVARY